MKCIRYIIAVLTAAILVCHSEENRGQPEELCFYQVSRSPIDGGQFVDTPGFAKLGYIAKKPDLVVKELKFVTPSSSPDTVAIGMSRADAAAFTTLTGNAVGKQLLVMLGKTPICAPLITGPIPTPTQSISLNLPAAKTAAAKVALEKLVK